MTQKFGTVFLYSIMLFLNLSSIILIYKYMNNLSDYQDEINDDKLTFPFDIKTKYSDFFQKQSAVLGLDWTLFILILCLTLLFNRKTQNKLVYYIMMAIIGIIIIVRFILVLINYSSDYCDQVNQILAKRDFIQNDLVVYYVLTFRNNQVLQYYVSCGLILLGSVSFFKTHKLLKKEQIEQSEFYQQV